MKVLLINCVYQNGSTGKIVYDIYQGLLREGQECAVYYGRGESFRSPGVQKCCPEIVAKCNNLISRFTGMMYGGCLFSTRRLCRMILREKPDVVHLHCINGYFVNIYRLISFLKEHRIKTVLTNHAEFYYTANCGHALDCEKWRSGCGNCPRLNKETKSLFLDGTARSWQKMQESFHGFRDLVVTSVSPWLQERAMSSPILGEMKHLTVRNGVDTSVFHHCPDADFLRENALEGKKILFHATAHFSPHKEHLKGGFYILELAKRFWEVDKNVVFVIAGSYDPPANLPPNVRFLGKLKDQKILAKWYSLGDLTLLTSKKETFSMIVAESLCCGTPVVGFEAGAPEMIAIKEYSQFVPNGALEKLFETVEEFLNSRSFDKSTISACAQAEYGREEMVAQYIQVYKDLVRAQ